MKAVLEPLGNKGFLFRRLEPFDLKRVGSRKRIGVYCGVDEAGRHTLVFHIRRKSRLLSAEAKELIALKAAIMQACDYEKCQCLAVVEAPLCSKAAGLLEADGWKIVTV